MESKRISDIVREAKSPYGDYCFGYPGIGTYFTCFLIGKSSVPIKFSHAGSTNLDEIDAFDMSETSDAYVGQINMVTASSFCGPHGVIWGHDVVRNDSHSILDLLDQSDIDEFRGLQIHHGKNLREAARALFGTVDNPQFPLLPGSHVFTANKFLSMQGPAVIYGAFAVGIPENRQKSACVFMEDVGFLKDNSREEQITVVKNAVRSVQKIARNQKIAYPTVYVDIETQLVEKDEMGGILVASPYFLLAQNAYVNSDSLPDTLVEWKEGLDSPKK